MNVGTRRTVGPPFSCEDAIADISVPVTVDAVRATGQSEIVRCVYYVVRCDDPSPGWQLTVSGNSVPFLMLDLAGIIYRPSVVDAVFARLATIDACFRRIDDPDRGIYVAVDDLQIPRRCFECSRTSPERGRTFRLSETLFRYAYHYHKAEVTLDRYLEGTATQFTQDVFFREEEDRAFRMWRAEQVTYNHEEGADE